MNFHTHQISSRRDTDEQDILCGLVGGKGTFTGRFRNIMEGSKTCHDCFRKSEQGRCFILLVFAISREHKHIFLPY